MAPKTNQPECFLGSVLNPGEFWLISQLRSHVKEVRHLEEHLSEEMNKIFTTTDPDLLSIHNCVAVESSSNRGAWRRGQVLHRKENDVFNVFLIDSGCVTEASVKNIQIIKEEKYTAVEPLAFRLCLYGLVPCHEVENSSKKQVSQHWSQEAQAYVHNLFSKKLLIYAKDEHIIKRTVFGDIYFLEDPNGHLLSLRRLLCKNNFAVYSEIYYREKVMSDDSSLLDGAPSGSRYDYNAELSMKLSRVEEWRLSNLRYETQRRAHELQKAESAHSSPASRRHRERSRTRSHSGSSRATRAYEQPLHHTSRNASKARSEPNVPRGPRSRNSRLEREPVPVPKKKMSLKPYDENKDYTLIVDDDFIVVPEVSDERNPDIFHLLTDPMSKTARTFRDLNISQELLRNLERQGDFKNLSPVQRWSIPAIQKGRDTVILGGPKTGKTLSYLIPIIESLTFQCDVRQLIPGNGPVAVIICSGSRACEYIFKVCSVLSAHYPYKNRIPEWRLRLKFRSGIMSDTYSMVQLTNGCDVLISTPNCLVRLLKYSVVLNFDRLRYLVFDETQIITEEPFLTQLKLVLHKTMYGGKVQRVFCGEKWSPELGHLVKLFSKEHAVVIGSFLEAVVYRSIRPHVLYCNSEDKVQVLLERVLTKVEGSKIMIVCEKTCEVLGLGEIFNTLNRKPLIAHSDMRLHEIKDVSRMWKHSKHEGIIICTDDAVHKLCISDVEALINYSLPSESKTNFSNRFSTIMETLRTSSSVKMVNARPAVVIMLDDQNHVQLPHIVELIRRTGGKIPDEIEDICDEIIRQIETSKVNVPLCQNILEFGNCRNSKRCCRRHAFIKGVDSTKIPLCGVVKFQVVSVHSTSHLSVQLTELYDEDNCHRGITFEDLSSEISDRLQEYYSLEQNRKFLCSVKVGSSCALQCTDLDEVKFYRGKIIELKKSGRHSGHPSEATVRLIDVGYQFSVEVAKLYELPQELKILPPQAIDVYLCNIMPIDHDRDWSQKSVAYAKDLFLQKLKENQFWMGRIKLSLDSILYLDSVKLCHIADGENTVAVVYSVNRKLLSSFYAVENRRVMEFLYSLCEQANIQTFIYDLDKDCEKFDIQPEHAFFDNELVKVQFVSAENYSCIYLRIDKFNELLFKLESDCQLVGENLRHTENFNIRKFRGRRRPRVGMHCLALHRFGWNRARIDSVDNGKISVFYIDYGDSECSNHLVPIPEKLLLQLPAQAIECYLAGIGEEVIPFEKILEEVYNFSNEGDDALYAQVIEKGVRSDTTGGLKYGINLLNSEGKSLNKRIIESGYVKPADNYMDVAVDINIAPSDSEEYDSDFSEKEDVAHIEKFFKNVAEPVPNDDVATSLEKMDAQLLADENSQSFLQDFMDQIMPKNYVMRNTGKRGIFLERELGHFSEKKGSQTFAFSRPGMKRLSTEASLNEGKICSLGLTCTPDVFWSQNQSEVQIRILVTDVQYFKFDCTVEYFSFSCEVNEKLYSCCIKLFGGISPQQTRCEAKTFFIVVLFRKLCSVPWPRLVGDTLRYRWIRYDVEGLVEKKSTFAEELCTRALRSIQRGNVVAGDAINEVSFVPSDNDHCGATDSESNSDDHA